MKIEKISKDSFVVIGKEGSTTDGDGFIQRLWQDAKTHFEEIADLAKRDESGNLVGISGDSPLNERRGPFPLQGLKRNLAFPLELQKGT